MRNEEEKSRSLATLGMTQAGSDARVARLRRRSYKGKSEDGDIKSPLQNGKMRNEEEKSRSLATLGMT